MGKLKKNSKAMTNNGLEEHENGIDWEQLLTGYQNQSVDEILANLMNKIKSSENVEFDQVILILKYYLIQKPDSNVYLDAFLQKDHIKALIDRFNFVNQNPNIQWMISELLKLLSSIFNKPQATRILSVNEFQQFILIRIFDPSLPVKLSNPSASLGLSQTETITFANMFDTISNLCEIKSELINCMTMDHIDWLYKVLIHLNHIHYKELITSIENVSVLTNKENTLEILIDLYLKKNLFTTVIEALNKNSLNIGIQTQMTNNLSAKLYMIGSLVNLVLSYNNFEKQQQAEKGEFLLNILESYGCFIESSLSVCLDDNHGKHDVNNNENDELLVDNNENESKKTFKSFESSIECKLLALEIIKSVSDFFSKENDSNESEEEIWEDCDSDEEMAQSNGKMEVETEETNTSLEETSSEKKFKHLVKKQNLFELLVRAIKFDNENVYQDANKIEHIYESIKFIKTEACDAYSLIFKMFIARNESIEELNVEKDLVDLLVFLNQNFNKDASSQEEEKQNSKVALKFVELIYDLYTSLNNQNKLSMESKPKIVILCQELINKYKELSVDLTARLVKILGMIAIKERDTNIKDGLNIIQECGHFLLNMPHMIFELKTISNIDCLRLNAEFFDSIIDLFADENLSEVERNLNFLEKIQILGEKFYSKYKMMGKNQKVIKEEGLIIKIVRDNLKPFIEYKIKQSS